MPAMTDELQNNINISDDIKVYGNVGRLSYQKNHIFLLDVFKNILEKSGHAVTVRRTLGSDINASCGQLRREHEKSISEKR